MTTLQIRPLTRAELGAGLDWAAEEGWNPGLHDADSFHATDPGGFLLGLLDAEPVSMISAVRYGAGFGFIGFYIVRPAWRGRGHGLAVWRAAMERLAGRTIGLDGVVAQQAAYRRSGFALAWNNVRYEGVARRIARADAPQVSIEPLTQATAELLDYDAPFFPEDRSRFVRLWIAQAGSTARAARRRGRFAGYGAIRPCRSGFKVGPLFADDAELADRLLCELVACVPAGAPVQLDIPAANPSALDLVRAHGMRPVFETARMYTGVAPRLPIARLFGITTFELG